MMVSVSDDEMLTQLRELVTKALTMADAAKWHVVSMNLHEALLGFAHVASDAGPANDDA